MTLLTGWCLTRDHTTCPGTVRRTQDAAPDPCPCDCHERLREALG